MGTRATDVVLVLSQVGEVREGAEGADNLGRLIVREPVQDRFELLSRGCVVVAMEADGRPVDAFNDVEHLLTLLLADDAAQDAAEQADVLAERFVPVTIQVRSDFSQIGSPDPVDGGEQTSLEFVAGVRSRSGLR